MEESEWTAAVVRAQQLIVNGNHAGAVALYGEVWERAIASGDRYGACVMAHFMAHAQRGAEAQLAWHQRALAAADDATAAHDERVVPFYPSLYANMAEVCLRLGDVARARK